MFQQLFPDALRHIASFLGDLRFAMTCKHWQQALRLTRIKENGGLDTVHVNDVIDNAPFHALIGPRTQHLHFCLPSLYSLTQLKNFKLVSLSLNGWNTDIIELPTFPSTLRQLTLKRFENVQVIPDLPSGLQRLTLHTFKNVQVIPDLPSGLQHLTLYFLSHIQVIPNLPRTLQQLTIKLLISLQTIPDLPSGLQQLSLSYLDVHVIPTLPSGLQQLSLEHLQNVQVIPELPKTL
jgi:hypothetical protein